MKARLASQARQLQKDRANQQQNHHDQHHSSTGNHAQGQGRHSNQGHSDKVTTAGHSSGLVQSAGATGGSMGSGSATGGSVISALQGCQASHRPITSKAPAGPVGHRASLPAAAAKQGSAEAAPILSAAASTFHARPQQQARQRSTTAPARRSDASERSNTHRPETGLGAGSGSGNMLQASSRQPAPAPKENPTQRTTPKPRTTSSFRYSTVAADTAGGVRGSSTRQYHSSASRRPASAGPVLAQGLPDRGSQQGGGCQMDAGPSTSLSSDPLTSGTIHKYHAMGLEDRMMYQRPASVAATTKTNSRYGL